MRRLYSYFGRKIAAHMPTREKIFSSRFFRPLAPLFDKPYFWHLNRRKAASAVAVGMFCGLFPGPTQMAGALFVAYFLRTNLPVAVFTTLYTNPLTYLPLYYLAYTIGYRLLFGHFPDKLPEFSEMTLSEMKDWLMGFGKPLLLGVPVLGAVLAAAGYVLTSLLWRCRIVSKLKRRAELSVKHNLLK